MKRIHRQLFVVCALTALILIPMGSAGEETQRQTINVAGTFNDWNPADPDYRMTATGDGAYRLQKAFRAGQYKFKFTVDGGWDKHFGGGPNNTLAEPGTDINLEIKRHGVYVIELDLNQRRWSVREALLESPQAVLIVRGPVEANLPVTLDGSESRAREGHQITEYQFGQDTNDTVRARLEHRDAGSPRAEVRLPREGTYRFWLKVNDGASSAPDAITLKPEPSYQVVGDWTTADPFEPVSFLQRQAPGEYEKILKSTGPGEHQLLLVKNHDEGHIVGNLTVSVTQTNHQLWRLRYEEKTKKLTCVPTKLVEFAYRPEDDAILKGRVQVHTVHVAGTFNNWDSTATPMTDMGDGNYVVYLQLDDGLYQYKFVVNGQGWMQDPKADISLRVEDGHGGFNSGIYVGQRGEEFGPQPPGDINMAAVVHRPNLASDMNVVSSDLAEVKLRVLRNDASKVTLHLFDGKEQQVAMRRGETAFGFDYWQADVFPDTTGKQVSYYFSLTDGATTRLYGLEEDPETKLGIKPFTTTWTVLFPTPDWAKHVVWYQIFPDRFRNGSKENDPPRTLPWRWDWYKFAAWERPNETRTFSNDWYARRFGGDFQGLIEKLPYFHELGVTALYFCPVFEANSYHGYDTIDYRHISQYSGFKGDNEKVITQETLDPTTWQWTPSDKLFLEFVQKAHAQGLKVIVDGVFNHMGKGAFALEDVLAKGHQSEYADWFDVFDWGPPVKYRSWDGGGWMPNFRKNSERGIASDSARKYLFDVTRRWMDPNGDGDPSDGIDGWRLDVAADVPSAFWIDWRQHVKSINPRAYITGEHWGEAVRYLQGDQWDAVMNYQFVIRANRFFIDQKRKISASEFDRQLKELLAMYPMQVNFVMQNLYDSHDTDRLVNMIINPDRDYDQCNRPQDGCPYNGSKPGSDAYQVMKLMTTFQMTFLGAPMIWYGNEAGMYGADDPTDRKPMLWKDLQPYDNPQDYVMDDVWNHFRKLIAIRNSYPALRTGRFQSVLVDNARDLYGFTRTRGDEIITVVVNNGSHTQIAEVTVPFPDGSKVVDLMAASIEFHHAAMAAQRFPQFVEDATVLSVRAQPNPGSTYNVRDGKVLVNLGRKSAAILVKQ